MRTALGHIAYAVWHGQGSPQMAALDTRCEGAWWRDHLRDALADWLLEDAVDRRRELPFNPADDLSPVLEDAIAQACEVEPLPPPRVTVLRHTPLLPSDWDDAFRACRSLDDAMTVRRGTASGEALAQALARLVAAHDTDLITTTGDYDDGRNA